MADDGAWDQDKDPGVLARWVDKEISADRGAAVSDAILSTMWDAHCVDAEEWMRIEAVLRKHKCLRTSVREMHKRYSNGSAKEKERSPSEEPPPPTDEDRETDTRPQVVITKEERDVANQAIAILGKRDDIYKRGGMLVHIGEAEAGDKKSPVGTPIVIPAPMSQIRSYLSESMRWLKPNKEGNLVRGRAPDWCIKDIHERGEWKNIRHLMSVTEVPVLRSDGTILTTPGYDDQSGIEYRPSCEMPKIPESPTYEDAYEAYRFLIEAICDFPFKESCHASAWIAGLLTPLARYSFHGSAPLFAIDSNVAGAGKGLLAHIISTTITGREMAIMTQARDVEEDRKRITALTLRGARLILLDNVSSTLGSAAIDAAITGTTWQERVLGATHTPELPLVATWYATGNNLSFAPRSDTSRRTLHIRIESPLEKPEERSGFKHPDLLKWVVDNRPKLLAAALTILRGYFVAGKPDQKLVPWGSFEAWSSVVRSAIVWCDQPDPVESRVGLRETADPEAKAIPGLLDGLEELAGTEAGVAISGQRGITANKILDAIEKDPERWSGLDEAITTLCQKRTSRSLGMRLTRLTGRVIGAQKLWRGEHAHTALWCVVDADWAPRTHSQGSFSSFDDSPKTKKAKKDEPEY